MIAASHIKQIIKKVLERIQCPDCTRATGVWVEFEDNTIGVSIRQHHGGKTHEKVITEQDMIEALSRRGYAITKPVSGPEVADTPTGAARVTRIPRAA